MGNGVPLCQILKPAFWQDTDATKVSDTLDGWIWTDEELTPMSEISETIAEGIRVEFDNDITQSMWKDVE